jgi:hypothetical protein
VYLLVEQPTDPSASSDLGGVLGTPGVAGVLELAASAELGAGPDQGQRFGVPAWDPGGSLVTLVFLDGDVEQTSAAVEPWARARWASGGLVPRFAGPFRSPTHHDAWPG